jgi:hypothetical protein
MVNVLFRNCRELFGSLDVCVKVSLQLPLPETTGGKSSPDIRP